MSIAKHSYVLLQKLWTSAELYEPLQLEGIYLFTNSTGRSTAGRRASWIAVRTIDAASWNAAYEQASQHVIGLVDRLHVVTQCVFSLVGASWFLWSAEGGSPRVLIANQYRPGSVVPIHLWNEKQLGDVDRLKAAKAASLLYFRESGRASTAKTKLAMLVIAAESLAGSQEKSSKCNRCSNHPALLCPTCNQENSYGATDMDAVKNIFGTELFKALYRDPENVRNKLMHGSFIPEAQAHALALAAYTAFTKHLQRKFALECTTDIRNAPRPLDGVDAHAVCLRAPIDWLPKVQDVTTAVEWVRVFNELESADLNSFGERIDIPEWF